MSKSEVYSWRLTPELKERLVAVARREGISLADLLEAMAAEWLDRHADPEEERLQQSLQEAAAPWLGSLAGDDPQRSRRVREGMRRKLGERRRPAP